MPPNSAAELYDELKTTAIHIIRGWLLSDAERITFCFAGEDIHLEQKEALNRYSTVFSFQKHQLPIWVRLTNQARVDTHRFAADGTDQTQ